MEPDSSSWENAAYTNHDAYVAERERREFLEAQLLAIATIVQEGLRTLPMDTAFWWSVEQVRPVFMVDGESDDGLLDETLEVLGKVVPLLKDGYTNDIQALRKLLVQIGQIADKGKAHGRNGRG